ncbi:MAG: hypothetical protein HOV79_25480 [Hamadaea sp.]|nr:hypothetical protein [Hamadaea sp.]
MTQPPTPDGTQPPLPHGVQPPAPDGTSPPIPGGAPAPMPGGYEPPMSAYQPMWPQQGWSDPTDPLVNPPGVGIGGWFGRISSTFQRSWRSMAAVFALTHLLPSLILGVVITVVTVVSFLPWYEDLIEATATGERPDFDVEPAAIAVFAGVLLVSIVVILLMNSVGYAAATYAVTREAAGTPAPLGEALRYGLRRCLGLTGWTFVAGLLAVLGFLACILPGIYVLAGTALVGPVYLFERRSPIGRSFGILHADFGRVLGRLLMIVVIMIGGSIVGGSVDNMVTLVGQSSSTEVYVAMSVVGSVISTVIALPFTMFQFAAILLTYAEQRGSEAPTSTVQLASEL